MQKKHTIDGQTRDQWERGKSQVECALTNRREDFWVHVTFPAFPLVTRLPVDRMFFLQVASGFLHYLTSVTDPKTLLFLLRSLEVLENNSIRIFQLTFGFVSQTARLSLNTIQVYTVAESGRTIAMADPEAAFPSSCNWHLP